MCFYVCLCVCTIYLYIFVTVYEYNYMHIFVYFYNIPTTYLDGAVVCCEKAAVNHSAAFVHTTRCSSINGW